MPTLTLENIQEQIKSRKLLPVYLLHGEEDYYIDKVTQLFENNLLDEAQKEFDYHSFYGMDLKSADMGFNHIVSVCRSYPMLSLWQLVIVKEAQNLDHWDLLENYLNNPNVRCVLVLAHKHKKIDTRKKIFKSIEKVGGMFESSPIRDYQVPQWIGDYLRKHQYSIEPNALGLVAESFGTNLNLIANELEKLFLNLSPGSCITTEHIQKFIGINKDYNVFSLEKALSEKDMVRILKITHYFKANIKDFPLPMIIPQLYRFFSRVLMIHSSYGKIPETELCQHLGINKFFLNQYLNAARYYTYRKAAQNVSLLYEYDKKSKGLGSSTSPEELLDEMIFRISH